MTEKEEIEYNKISSKTISEIDSTCFEMIEKLVDDRIKGELIKKYNTQVKKKKKEFHIRFYEEVSMEAENQGTMELLTLSSASESDSGIDSSSILI